MGLFSRKKKEERAEEVSFEDPLLQALLGTTSVTKSTAMQIPTVAGAISLIAETIASTPLKLYKEGDGQAEEVKGDVRTVLLNDDTGDTLNANEFWKAIVRDYFLGKGGYAYINKAKGKYKSLHYVDETYVTIQKNTDPIFKDYDIMVNGKSYKPFDFIKILRNTKDGASGTPITADHSKIIEVAYESLVFESNLVKKGGNKKGFLKSAKKLTDPAMDALKAAYKKLYGNNEENVVVLNDGIDFQESSNTSVEMQLNENKTTNSSELSKIFHVSPALISGTATELDMSSLAKLAAIPLMITIQCALNKDFLLEKEKGVFYWAFDTKELLKGGLLERYQAYEIAVKNGWKTRNEIRFQEDDEKIEGMDVISMNLADVIYDIKAKTYFTPNTKQITDTSGGGEVVNKDES
ncbi:phage portal protein [Dehalobacter sp. DCM]|uniref:phage portal protein n=1 Tax=Dehalobacter sp. DCM TaxID=2907827 RepID=UPI0030820022|nr:phage portal protein [Dehalobacter sp. DCM]